MRQDTSLYTSAQCRELDRRMIEQQDVTGFDLMRRAGQAAFSQLTNRWPEVGAVTVFCGKGNNAGDGYIIAGLARQLGIDVQLRQIGASAALKGDAAQAESWARGQGVVADGDDAAVRGDVIVDALLGTGLRGAVRRPFSDAISQINASGRPVLAVDVPSGVNADTGAVAGVAVLADVTVSFIGQKLGLHTAAGLDLRGQLVHAGLGVSDAVLAQVPGCPLLKFNVADLPSLTPNQYKHQLGHLVVVGGDEGMGGAPLMAAEAALRTGTGLVTVLTRPTHQAAMLARRPELMLQVTEDAEQRKALLSRASAIVVGPGLGREFWGEHLFALALAAGKPLVLDADGLRWLAKSGPMQVGVPAVITPHVGEAGDLLNLSAAQVQADRPGCACRLATQFGCVAVLKGAGTLCAGEDLLGLCAHGNPGMATAGMGDVLAGVIGGLLAQGRRVEDAATAGVCLHSRAGDLAAKRRGQRSLLASDLLDAMIELLP